MAKAIAECSLPCWAAALLFACGLKEQEPGGAAFKPGRYYLASQLKENFQEGTSFIDYSEGGRIWIARKFSRECWQSEEIGTLALAGEAFTLDIDSALGDAESDTCNYDFPDYKQVRIIKRGKIRFPSDSTLLWCVEKGGDCGAGPAAFSEYVLPNKKE